MHPAASRYMLLPALALTFLLSGCGGGFTPETLPKTAPVYDYPLNNPFAATVIGMPPEQKVDLSHFPEPDEKTLTVFPDRTVPDGFWAEEGLHYEQLLQSGQAPIIYVIAGTGGDARAGKMRALAKIFYATGFHVVLLPSPTHPNFIINASEHFYSLRPIDAAPDLYRVIRRIDARIAGDRGISDRMITGYSLGAMNAAFTAALDEREQALRFSRVLLINPPYDLNQSIARIDKMLYAGMPGGMDDVDHFIEKIMARLGGLNQSSDALDFENERLLLDAYEQDKLDVPSMKTTIGLSFRLSAANMILASDIMGRTGYIFPADADFAIDTDMDGVMAVALRTGFADIGAEYYRAHPNRSTSQMGREDSLAYLDSYIRGNPKFGLVTNIDDVILSPGEAEKLASLFGKQAHLFNNGGHLGNMTHPAVAYAIAHFMLYGGQP